MIGSSGKAFKQCPYSKIPTFSFLTSQKALSLGYSLKAPLRSSSSVSKTANETVTSLGIVWEERGKREGTGVREKGKEEGLLRLYAGYIKLCHIRETRGLGLGSGEGVMYKLRSR